MKHLIASIPMLALLASGQVAAAEQVQVQQKTQAQSQQQTQSRQQVRDQERVYGSQLMTEQERREQSRIVEINDRFIALCPYASRFPFETWIMPLRHEPSFKDIQENEINSLASVLRQSLYRIQSVLDSPHYNFIVQR